MRQAWIERAQSPPSSRDSYPLKPIPDRVGPARRAAGPHKRINRFPPERPVYLEVGG
jgi:hypothetical protein